MKNSLMKSSLMKNSLMRKDVKRDSFKKNCVTTNSRTIQGFSLLELMIVLAILSLASALALFSYTPKQFNKQISKVQSLILETRDKSFYQQSTLRLICNGDSLQQQRYKVSENAIPVIFGQPSGSWLNTDTAFELEYSVCLEQAATSTCSPCPNSSPSQAEPKDGFSIKFSDGLAAQSYSLEFSNKTLASAPTPQVPKPITENEQKWLKVSANGMVQIQEPVPLNEQ